MAENETDSSQGVGKTRGFRISAPTPRHTPPFSLRRSLDLLAMTVPKLGGAMLECWEPYGSQRCKCVKSLGSNGAHQKAGAICPNVLLELLLVSMRFARDRAESISRLRGMW